MRKVYEASTSHEAHLVKLRLESAGIPAVVEGSQVWGIDTSLSMEIAPTVFVTDDADAERAREIVRDYEDRMRESLAEDDGKGPAAKPWNCPECGQENPANFSECWSCAAK